MDFLYTLFSAAIVIAIIIIWIITAIRSLISACRKRRLRRNRSSRSSYNYRDSAPTIVKIEPKMLPPTDLKRHEALSYLFNDVQRQSEFLNTQAHSPPKFDPSVAQNAFSTIYNRIPRAVIEVSKDAKPSHINVGGYYPQISYLRKNQSYKSLRDFVAIDVETTGLEVGYQKIIQICAIRFVDLKAIEKFETYINPGKHIPWEATNINHITDEMVRDSPRFEQIVDSLDNFIGSSPLVAHKIEFDIRFLRKSGYDNEKYPRKYYDTLQISRSRDKYIDNHKLVTACDCHSIYFDKAHSSSADALACGLLFLAYIRSNVDSCMGKPSEYDNYKQVWDVLCKTSAEFNK